MANFMTKFKQWVTGDDLDHDICAMESEFDLAPTAHSSQSMMYSGNPNRMNIEDDLMLLDRPAHSKRSRRNLRVVDSEQAAGSSRHAEVKVIEPRAFEESLEIVEYLRASKSVVLNLHHLDTAQSQRVVDFLSGATHAIDGHQQRIGDGVFIFTPQHVNISSAVTSEEADESPYDNHTSFWK